MAVDAWPVVGVAGQRLAKMSPGEWAWCQAVVPEMFDRLVSARKVTTVVTDLAPGVGQLAGFNALRHDLRLVVLLPYVGVRDEHTWDARDRASFDMLVAHADLVQAASDGVPSTSPGRLVAYQAQHAALVERIDGLVLVTSGCRPGQRSSGSLGVAERAAQAGLPTVVVRTVRQDCRLLVGDQVTAGVRSHLALV